jgi:hypothetical protein
MRLNWTREYGGMVLLTIPFVFSAASFFLQIFFCAIMYLKLFSSEPSAVVTGRFIKYKYELQ